LKLYHSRRAHIDLRLSERHPEKQGLKLTADWVADKFICFQSAIQKNKD